MEWALAALLTLTVLAAVLSYLWPITVSISLAAKLTPAGQFAIVSGASVGPMSLALATARGVPPRLVVQGLGRVWVNDSLSNLAPRRAGPSVPLSTWIARAERAWALLTRFFDPIDLAFALLQERRVVRVGWIDARVRYGLDDPATMGLWMGWLLVLDNVLGGRVTVRPDPIWHGERELALDVDGVVRVYPVRSALALAWFLVRNVRVFRRDDPAHSKEATHG
ncbi:MAG: hypothetical protein IT374_08805 [Polyangiaceae bacterium]|nr:hypothetical protein [Polyangiaceae bacterium]